MTVPGNLYPYSTTESIERDMRELRASFKSGVTRDLKARRQVLLQLRKMLQVGGKELSAALRKDLHKGEIECALMEVAVVDNEIQEHLDYMDDWAKPEKVSTNVVNLPGSSCIQRDPLGVVCIISTWNYPVQLTFQPLVGAISAGNTVLLRLPGDDTCVHTNNAIIKLLDEYVDKRFVRYVHGDVEASKVMLDQRFDLIFCTGGTFIGKIVAAAAAKHLTPTILELGGKSPAIIDETCDLTVTVQRLAWASLVNAGQTCVRPDYVLVSSKIGDKFVALLEKTLREFFGEDPQKSEDLCRLVNARQFERVAGILIKDKAHITFGGAMDAKDRYIEPTLLNFKGDFQTFRDAACMGQEIFGPLLPIYYYETLDECIDFINEHEKPLALYGYTSSSANREKILRETSSGSVCINDAIVQLTNSCLPFGGVGQSGMGSYHGKQSFDSFSHKKSVLVRSTWLDVKQRYYPYKPSDMLILGPSLKPITRKMITTLKSLAFAVGMSLIAVAIKFAVQSLGA
ncbi:hypothetical protein Poli38472_002675 [Pythium oligandrum]|uniref:Aldehyde dehydrogenase n=1 Tax=Pythium oligandrum TaxID=41045 RepID=A0A8K1FK19_PYTOL|nr:hypothetical protein Poli38472_002675 [Pythium oligandrum]|eukprot:TMW63734.1 hypothetical protein Poli38472_002675 [Pythium oligandrum]